MSAIERIMRAYASKHELNLEQAALVRLELSDFISKLMYERPQPTKFSDGSHREAGISDQGSSG